MPMVDLYKLVWSAILIQDHDAFRIMVVQMEAAQFAPKISVISDQQWFFCISFPESIICLFVFGKQCSDQRFIHLETAVNSSKYSQES